MGAVEAENDGEEDTVADDVDDVDVEGRVVGVVMPELELMELNEPNEARAGRVLATADSNAEGGDVINRRCIVAIVRNGELILGSVHGSAEKARRKFRFDF